MAALVISSITITGKKEIAANRAIHVLDISIVIKRSKAHSPHTHIRRNIILFVSDNITFYKSIQFRLLSSRSLFYILEKVRDYLLAYLVRQKEFPDQKYFLDGGFHLFWFFVFFRRERKFNFLLSHSL